MLEVKESKEHRARSLKTEESPYTTIPSISLLEDDFPFEYIGEIAATESWRKEVYRPIYHVHKWWAQRLGSVFRSLILGAISKPKENLESFFYTNEIYSSMVVFDPFMGSGTTVGEAVKIGLKAIGRDINPVSFFAVKSALSKIDRENLTNAFSKIEMTAGVKIRELYQGIDSQGRPCSVLYYFWVKKIQCPKCSDDVSLFSNYIFAKHAYPKKYPQAKCVCPRCLNILTTRYDAMNVRCNSCSYDFSPQKPAHNQTATCTSCDHKFPIAKTIKSRGNPPDHKMYAKLVLNEDGDKEYLPITDFDISKFEIVRSEFEKIKNPYPTDAILEGYNTSQAINYGYSKWYQFFNERQILAINILAKQIGEVEDLNSRELLFCLLSGTLEFNNMFASYKGEGTGAVRHMFSHHILKPEKMPIEANLWGTPKSSGSFSTLFRSRILRSLDYKDEPFEIKEKTKAKVSTKGLKRKVVHSYSEFEKNNNSTYISCGDSSSTDIPSETVDLVLTDPPFFDNVNYSELADFFYVWQRHFKMNGQLASASTRSDREVQHRSSNEFSNRLASVFEECNRVLKRNGMLVFSYHHSRDEGWIAVAESVWRSGFDFTAAFPIKAEMSGATPKSAAKEPIDFDIILVCRKSDQVRSDVKSLQTFEGARDLAFKQMSKLSKQKCLSKNDKMIILMGQFIVAASSFPDIQSRCMAFKKFTLNL
jgi:adenine-specific DNA methylase